MGNRKSFKWKEKDRSGQGSQQLTALKWNWLKWFMLLLEEMGCALGIADQGLHHKLVLKVENLVAV